MLHAAGRSGEAGGLTGQEETSSGDDFAVHDGQPRWALHHRKPIPLWVAFRVVVGDGWFCVTEQRCSGRLWGWRRAVGCGGAGEYEVSEDGAVVVVAPEDG